MDMTLFPGFGQGAAATDRDVRILIERLVQPTIRGSTCKDRIAIGDMSRKRAGCVVVFEIYMHSSIPWRARPTVRLANGWRAATRMAPAIPLGPGCAHPSRMRAAAIPPFVA
jgi:hypothetical protein